MHLVRINLGARPPGGSPQPLRPAVEIDGMALNAVGVSVVAKLGELTRVAILVDAAVEIDVLADVAFTTDPLDGLPPSSDTRLILAAIRSLEDQMTDLTQAEADESAAVASVITELQTISGELTTVSQQLTAALAANDQAAAQAAAQQLEASAQKLNAAVTAAQAGDPTPKPAPPPAPPSVSPTSISGVAGQALSGQFTLSPAPADPVTWSVVDNPPDISVASDGTISGTPAAAEAGDMDVTAKDSTGAVVAELKVAYSISAAPAS